MSEETLRKLAPRYGFEPEIWHYQLSRRIPAMAVIGIFRHAIRKLDERTGVGVLVFHSKELAEKR